MLTDVFVPLLTYPEEAKPRSLPHLSALLDVFATSVTYCAVEVDVPDLADRWGSALVALPQMAAEVERRSRENAVDLLAGVSKLSERLAAGKMNMRAAFGDPGFAVARKARDYDLTAVTMGRGNADQISLAEDLIFGSGRPLLMVPEAVEHAPDLSRLAIAWDGSTTAYRAVYDAMPLIARASDVFIITATEDKAIPRHAVDALAAYLNRHGVASEVAEVSDGSSDIAIALQELAVSERAGLLIMGAYGHSRLREFVLGGATAGVLRNPIVPIFMSR